MIKSMTGFGRAETADSSRKFIVEIKSVNHRYLDFNIRMPKKFCLFEGAIRNILKEYMQRGKVDVFINYEDYTANGMNLKYNREMAARYLEYLNQMSDEFHLENDIRVSTLSRYPEVFSMEDAEADEKELWNGLGATVREAAEQFAKSRSQEGESLKKDIQEKLANLERQACLVEERSPQIMSEYRGKLEAKMRELLEDSQIEESRIAAEAVLFADKMCTDEETVRLKSHIRSMQDALIEGANIGRKLDFIAQELNREANTILSKANDITTSNIAIELKTEIEKIREQIQNIE